jgi:hypothetical protein
MAAGSSDWAWVATAEKLRRSAATMLNEDTRLIRLREIDAAQVSQKRGLEGKTLAQRCVPLCQGTKILSLFRREA